jgi:hypothetical protein
MFGHKVGHLGRVGSLTLAQRVSAMFSRGEPGAWYDPSDMSTLFQDSAGTTPVTAVEQPVGLMLDKSGRGNRAIQATTTKRPIYSRRVNLLVGSTTLATQSITTLAAAYTLAFSGAGSVTLSGAATGTFGAGRHVITCTAGSLTLTVSGAVTDARCGLSIDAHLPYQLVNTDTDYDADPAKFPAYLRFDGVDDALQTGNIDFTGTDKMTAWAGVTKLSDANLAVITELSNGAVDGVISLQAPFGAGSPSFLYLSRGSTSRWASTSAYPSPSTAVLTGVSDISGDVVSLRVNTTVVGTTTTDQGAGNYGNYPLNIGARASSSSFFNGRLYGLIVRGAQSSLSQIEATELYIKQKMRLP